MKLLQNLLLIIFSVALFGCNSSSSYYEDEEVALSLVEVNIIDAYGHSDDDGHHTTLSINPYINDGFFEIFWLTYSSDPYSVEFLIGDNPNIHDATLVYLQSCEGEFDTASGCGELSNQSCFYTPTFELVCGGLEQAYGTHYDSYLGDLIYDLPQKMYFFVQVCEHYGNECEYDYRELVFE